MALGLRLCCLVTVLLLSCSSSQAKNVTNEEIHNVLLSTIHIFLKSEEKLDRHDNREKVQGDQIKKALFLIERKLKGLESLKGTISRIDERLSNVENIFLQKEEKEKLTQKKTNDFLEDIQKSLQSLTDLVAKNIKSNPPPAEVETNLTTDEDSISKRLDAMDANLNAFRQEIINLKNSLSKDALRTVCHGMSEGNPLERYVSEAEKLLNSYQKKLQEFNETSTKVQTDFVPLSEVSLADEAWHSKMTEVMERQEKDIKKIQQLLNDAESMWKDLPRLADLKKATNETLEAISDAATKSTADEENTVTKISMKLREISDRLVDTNKDIQQSLTLGNTMSEKAFNDMQQSYDNLRAEVQKLSKNEHVMLQTADAVIATKKRIEYGVNRILMEVGEIIRVQGKVLNDTMLQRFDAVEASILINQAQGLSNLTTTMESEMSQVWRQIGIMYQQLNASKNSVDKLAENTVTYINGTAIKMKSINEQVGQLTTGMDNMHDNLNYLLGRLSIVTQEFNDIKAGLSNVLDEVRSGLVQVQSKIHPSEDNTPELRENQVK